jgi:ATP-dependent protease ClpP protease subunit
MRRRSKYSKSLLWPTLVGACLLLSAAYAKAETITGKGIHFTTNKVSKLDFPLFPGAHIGKFAEQADLTSSLPGPRLIIINSPGGLVELGGAFIQAMESERQALGTRFICVIDGHADSMAFNILTHCDERYATFKSSALVHKIFFQSWPGGKVSAKNLRLLADELDAADAQYRQGNADAMHLTLKDYDLFADQEHTWTARSLVERGYLKGIVTIE